MCCKRERADQTKPSQTATYPYDGETISLEQFTSQLSPATPHQCSPHAHYWHLLWLLFPLAFVVKWLVTSTVLITGALWHMLWQPLVQDVSLLPLLLIVTGVLLLLRNSTSASEAE